MGSSSSPAGESPVRVAARSPVAGWRAALKTGRVEPHVQKPRGWEQLSGPQHEATPAASLGVKTVPSRGNHGEGHGSGEDPGDAAVKDCAADGAWHVQKVATGTGEALPGRNRSRCRWQSAVL